VIRRKWRHRCCRLVHFGQSNRLLFNNLGRQGIRGA